MFTDKNILFIGPYSKSPKGGIAFVLSEYEKIFPDAYFIASTNSRNSITKVLYFLKCLIHISFLLIIQPRIKIIHIHGASYNSFKRKYIIFKLASLFKKKIIYHIHGGAFHEFYETSASRTQKNVKFMLEKADCIVCLSETWKNYFQQNFSSKSLIAIPNIISDPKPDKHNAESQNPMRFLFLGLIGENKGIWLLMEVLRKIAKKLEGDAIFYIAGNGDTKKLQSLITEYNLESIVKYAGWVGGKEKLKLLNQSDVYLLPSYNEGLPLSILEAMSYSLPIISTTVGGIPEIVDANNGILTEPGNESMLSDAIISIIQSEPEVLKRMGNNSYKKAQPHLPKNVKFELCKLYNLLLENKIQSH